VQEKEIVCIICPVGCRVQVKATPGDDERLQVEGNECGRGKKYALEEFTNPTRVITSTVVIRGALLPRLPVKTREPVPRHLIFECLKELDRVEVESPVQVGEVIIKDVLGTGTDIVATRSMENISNHEHRREKEAANAD